VPSLELGARFAENRVHGLDLVEARGVAKIHDEQRCVRRFEGAREPRHRVLGREGRQVHELKMDILVRHHPGLWIPRRERIRRDMGPGACKARMQRRLAHVRRPDQCDLRRAFGPNHEGRTSAHPTLLGALEFFGQLLDAPFDVTLEMVRSLVFGDHTEHLPQPLQALLRVARLAELSLRSLVLGGEVGGHAGVRP